jgi:hypothetical protein
VATTTWATTTWAAGKMLCEKKDKKPYYNFFFSFKSTVRKPQIKKVRKTSQFEKGKEDNKQMKGE